MDFDQLKSFLEVARHSSFSRAAEKCFRTQPAISAQIRALEEEVGVKLFDRTGGKVSLTAAGKVFQRFAEETISARNALGQTLTEMERTPRGEIVIGANEATCLYVLPEVFAEFKRAYPNVSLGIRRSEHQKTLEAVLAKQLDFGVTSLPIRNPRLTVVPIHRDHLVLITWTGHPMARLLRATAAEIARYPLVLPKAGRTRGAIDEFFATRGLKPTVATELDSSELLKRFVAAGVGVGFIAASNVADDVRAGSLAAVPLADAEIRRDLALVYRKEATLSRAAQAFIEIAVQHKAKAAGAR